MTTFLLTFFFTAALLATGILLWSSRFSHPKRAALNRLSRLMQKRNDGPEMANLKSSISSLLSRFHSFRHHRRFGVAEEAGLQSRLGQAGLRHTQAADAYLVFRTFGPIAFMLLGGMFPSHRGFWIIALPGLFYLLPDLFLRQLIRRRKRRISSTLPDAVDLMVICVEAGLGVDQALSRVSQELSVSHPEITEEFVLVNLEQRAGKPRMLAWQDMAQRIDNQEVTNFVSMLVQTERFGTPIAKALTDFANGMRERRRERAEELAAKTTVKIIFPLAFFIFPSIFIVLLGPAVLTLLKNSNVFGSP